MTTLREAAQQALEAMNYSGMDVGKFNRINAACAALRAALAEPVQEPVRCPLCNYQYGHQIGCENNPLDIALAAAQSRQPAELVPGTVACSNTFGCQCPKHFASQQAIERAHEIT